jgi:outer membrane protein TolC
MDASWELDIFGANRLANTAAQSDVKAAEASYEDAKATLAAEVASAYVNLRLAQARLGVAQQNSKSRKETVNLTNLRQQAGLTSGAIQTQFRANTSANSGFRRRCFAL